MLFARGAWCQQFGQLGVGGTEDRLVPTLMRGLQDKQVVYVAAGRYHAICTTTDDNVFTWGTDYRRNYILCLAMTSARYRTIILILKTENFGHDFKTAEPLLHGQRVDGGVEFAIKIIA